MGCKGIMGKRKFKSSSGKKLREVGSNNPESDNRGGPVDVSQGDPIEIARKRVTNPSAWGEKSRIYFVITEEHFEGGTNLVRRETRLDPSGSPLPKFAFQGPNFRRVSDTIPGEEFFRARKLLPLLEKNRSFQNAKLLKRSHFQTPASRALPNLQEG